MTLQVTSLMAVEMSVLISQCTFCISFPIYVVKFSNVKAVPGWFPPATDSSLMSSMSIPRLLARLLSRLSSCFSGCSLGVSLFESRFLFPASAPEEERRTSLRGSTILSSCPPTLRSACCSFSLPLPAEVILMQSRSPFQPHLTPVGCLQR